MSDRLKRAVIKEELVALTGDSIKAVILNQFIYWSERVDDFDKFIAEERERLQISEAELGVGVELREGWIYKKAEEMAEETMINLSKSNMMNHIKVLVEEGWLEQRRNPKNKMDKTYQYRVNLVYIQKALLKIGYSIEGYRIPLGIILEAATAQLPSSDSTPRSSELELRSSHSKLPSSKIEPPGFETQSRSSDSEQQYQRLLTENTNMVVVEELKAAFEDQTGEAIDISQMKDLVERYGTQAVTEGIQAIMALAEWKTGPIGALVAALRQGWQTPLPKANPRRRKISSKDKKNPNLRDERYSAFYALFPDT